MRQRIDPVCMRDPLPTGQPDVDGLFPEPPRDCLRYVPNPPQDAAREVVDVPALEAYL